MGEILQACWNDLPNHYSNIELDEFIVMPNHVHGIILIRDVEAGYALNANKRPGLSEIVRAFKTFSARKINEKSGTPGVSIWQRNYYEHVIRNEDDLNDIRQYIILNPRTWAEDDNNPQIISLKA